MPSIFISHSSNDRPSVDWFKAKLASRGYHSLFIDYDAEHGIAAGSAWERELYRKLKLSGAVIVLCSPGSMASRWCFAEITQARALGKKLFPVILSPCQLDGLLKDHQIIDLTASSEDDGFRRLFDGLKAAGLDPTDNFDWDPARPPFPGFLHFEKDDAGIFFGRDEEVRGVIDKLNALAIQGEPRLLILAGPSGSGKSSVVRAGVVPRLERDPSRWVVVPPFRREGDPIAESARAIAARFGNGPGRPDWKDIRDRLKQEAHTTDPVNGSSVISDYADDLTMALDRREASVLLVVDQAEDLLQPDRPDESAAFLRVLLRAAARPAGRVHALLTLRSDFQDRLQNHTAMAGVPFDDRSLTLRMMPVERFPELIEGPAFRAGIDLDPALVTTITAGARTNDALPLLAFTLWEMYGRCREQSKFTLSVYRDELGGMNGVVERVVKRIKDQNKWSPEVDNALRQAFLKLVRMNDEGQFTRKPARWADLPEPALPALRAFEKSRLLTSHRETVEVTHESLFNVWPELNNWLQQSREFFLWRRRLQSDLADWKSDQTNPDKLLPAIRLPDARKWLEACLDDLEVDEKHFIVASVDKFDREADAERLRQERENENLRKLAAEATGRARDQANAARSLRHRLYVMCVVLLATILIAAYARFEQYIANDRTEAAETATVIARDQTRRAEIATGEALAEAKIATSRQLAAQSSLERNKRLDRSLLLAVEALRTEPTVEARDSLFKAIQDRPGVDSILDMQFNEVSSVAFSRDNTTVAVGYRGKGGGGGIALWNTTSRKQLTEHPLAVKEGDVTCVAFSPDGKTLAAGYYNGVVVWDTVKWARLTEQPLAVNQGGINSLAFSPDGNILAAGSSVLDLGGAVFLWEATTRARLADRPLDVKEGGVTGVTFSPDGKVLAAACGGKRGGMVLWDAATRERLTEQPVAVKEGYVQSVAFHPDGVRIAIGFAGNGGGGVVLWDMAQRARQGELPFIVKDGLVSRVTFSPDGNTLAAGHVGGVVLWDASGRRVLTVKEATMSDFAFSTNGKTIATGFGGPRRIAGGVMLWDASGRSPLMEGPLAVKGEVPVLSVAFSPDGKTLAAGSWSTSRNGGLTLWDAIKRTPLAGDPFVVKEGSVTSVAWSPGGGTVAAGYGHERGQGGVVLLDAAGTKRLTEVPLLSEERNVRSVAFGPDGTTLAAGYPKGVVLWDTAKQMRLTEQPLAVEAGSLSGVAFSPDGKALAAGHAGGVTLWDARGGKRLAQVPLGDEKWGVTCVAFSPRGIIAVGYSTGVELWDTVKRTRRTEQPLAVKEGYVRSVAFSPDGKTLAAGYDFAENNVSGVVLWETASWTRLAENPVVANENVQDVVSSVAFSPDNRTLAVGYRSFNRHWGAVILWDLDRTSWQLAAGRIANRNFTREEWRQYFPNEKFYHRTFRTLPWPPDLSDDERRQAENLEGERPAGRDGL